MVTEDYISFETAKLLKEKGFDCKKESITVMYREDGKFYSLSSADPYYYDYDDFDEYDYIAPTLQMATKWLREEKNCFIDIHNSNGDGYFYKFVDLRDRGHLFSNNCCRLLPTYEEACEAAIKYCLENLI